ncbi:MAG TPA: bifunctional adenosylcobinamide kinase/adenosylcobinamide-phosphate guanylyltransferase [Steroidobacteraceae bacterium]|nr:bifunctional adenosylcobinamide kinase/adenosylcobinamide-phosphate guanylyltransferase [Steroidobacteraceae bacterium]
MRTLILGGVRSGKSRQAVEIAGTHPVTLIVTGAARDEEMAARIEAHRRSRPPEWRVIEEPIRLAAALRRSAAPTEVVIVDCLTLWLSNLLCAGDAQALARESADLLETLPRFAGDCVLVSNDVGCGIVPVNALARRFADEAGTLHQRLAAVCDRVIWMVAGLPVTIKPGVS